MDKLRIDERPLNYDPESAVPLISKLEWDPPEVEISVKHVFNRWLLVRNSNSFSQLDHINAVTLDGDICSDKGVMTGGYRRPGTDKATLYHTHRIKEDRMYEMETELETKSKLLTESKRRISELNSRIQSRITDEYKRRNDIDELNSDLLKTEMELESIDETLKRNRTDLQKERIVWESLNQRKRNLEEEEEEEGGGDKTETSLSRQTEFVRELEQLRKEYFQAVKTVNQLETTRNVALNALKRSQDGLKDAEDRHRRRQGMKRDLNSKRNGLLRSQEALRETRTALTEVENGLEEFRLKIREKRNKIEFLDRKLQNLSQKRDEIQIKRDRLEKRRLLYQNGVRKAERSMSQYAVPGPETINKFKNFPPNECMKKIATISRKMNDIGDRVNIGAADQRTNLDKILEKSKIRFTKCKTDSESLNEALHALEEHKREKVHFTINQICRNFQTIFGSLIRGGSAQLIVERDPDTGEPRGIQVSASFLPSSAPTSDLEQFSVGQKSIIALTFLFAIQQCNPAPFYLFDEVDAALDAGHRKALSEWISSEITTSSQVICTTFRKELVQQADHCLGVKCLDNKSTVHEIHVDEALNFVVDE